MYLLWDERLPALLRKMALMFTSRPIMEHEPCHPVFMCFLLCSDTVEGRVFLLVKTFLGGDFAVDVFKSMLLVLYAPQDKLHLTEWAYKVDIACGRIYCLFIHPADRVSGHLTKLSPIFTLVLALL